MHKVFKKNVLIILVILLPSLLFHFYEFFPEKPKFQFYFLSIDSGLHNDVQYFMWLISMKLLTLSILSFWYVTNKSIVRHIITIPITLEIFKLYSTLKLEESGFYNLSDNLYSLLIAVVFIYALNLLSKRLGYRSENSKAELNEEINNQILKLDKFNTIDYKDLKNEILLLQTKRHKMNKTEYLKKLILLRDKLTID